MRRLVVGVAVVVLFSVGACSGADPVPIEPKASPKPTPTLTANPGPPVKPAPKAPKLTAPQKADYDTAVQRYADFEDFLARSTRNPGAVVIKDFAAELRTYTAMPATTGVADSFDGLVASGARVEGRSEIEWTVPIKVTATRVIFDQCLSPGTWTAIRDGEKTPQTDNILNRVYMAKISNTWRVANQEVGKKC